MDHMETFFVGLSLDRDGSAAERLACWTQAQKDPGSKFKSQSRRCRITVLGKLFIPIMPLFTKQQNGSSPFKGRGGNCSLSESNGSLPPGL